MNLWILLTLRIYVIYCNGKKLIFIISRNQALQIHYYTIYNNIYDVMISTKYKYTLEKQSWNVAQNN